VLLLSAAGSARAASEDPWLGGLARNLGREPVVVSASVSRAVSGREVARLRAAVRAMPVPTRVAILSGPPSSLSVEGLRTFELAELLAGAVDRPGLYVVLDASEVLVSSRMSLTAVGVQARVAPDDVERAVGEDLPTGTRAVTQLLYVLRIAAGGGRPRRGRAARGRDGGRSVSQENTVVVVSGAAGGLAAFAAMTIPWWRRRSRTAGPARLGPTVREPDGDTARNAADAVAQLAAAIAAAREPCDQAFELYSAAAKADREARTPIDHVGALLLARDGLAAVGGRTLPRRCFFDPGHGGATSDTRWRHGSEEAEVPACGRCAGALATGRAPDTLSDRGRPYYERATPSGRGRALARSTTSSRRRC